mgnify:CR=1 FL=1
MVNDDFSGDISNDDFEDEHHEHELKIKYFKLKVIAFKRW